MKLYCHLYSGLLGHIYRVKNINGYRASCSSVSEINDDDDVASRNVI